LNYIFHLNGSTRQSENQLTNTGVWQNGSCGGSNSAWLHCNGYIDYGAVSGGGGSSGGSSSGGSSSGSSSSSSGGSSSGGSLGDGTTCSNPTTISLPFSQNGSGNHCWFTNGTIRYVNSWNMSSLTINSTDYTNKWSNSIPARIDGGYYISYSGSYPRSHFEASGSKSAELINDKITQSLELNVFPNPSPTETFTVKVIGADGASQIGIMDIRGKLI